MQYHISGSAARIAYFEDEAMYWLSVREQPHEWKKGRVSRYPYAFMNASDILVIESDDREAAVAAALLEADKTRALFCLDMIFMDGGVEGADPLADIFVSLYAKPEVREAVDAVVAAAPLPAGVTTAVIARKSSEMPAMGEFFAALTRSKSAELAGQ